MTQRNEYLISARSESLSATFWMIQHVLWLFFFFFFFFITRVVSVRMKAGGAELISTSHIFLCHA